MVLREADFVKARLRIESKDHSLKEKILSLSEATDLVKDGDVVALGGTMYSRAPMAMIHEIIRKRKRNLTITRNMCSFEGDLLMTSGVAKKFITAWFSIGVPWGVSKIMRKFVEEGKVEMEEWSHLGMASRYQAAAMGVPFLPTMSMLGSDYLKHLPGKEIKCPFTGQKVLLVPALFPDATIIHVQRADKYGNLQVDGMPFCDREIALGGTKVIATTEQIVDSERIRSDNDRTLVPFFAVDAVVEVPYGAYPSECQGLYEPDFDHLDMYAKMIEEAGVDGAMQYLDKYIYRTGSFDGFLDLIPLKSYAKISRSMRILYGK